MELLRPAGVGVHLGHEGEEAVLILAHFVGRQLLAPHGFLEDGLYLRVGVLLVVELFDAVVAELASAGGEEVVALLQGVDHVGKAADGDAADLLELPDVVGKAGLLDVHGLVGAPGGNHDGVVGGLVGGVLDVAVQVVDGVVGGAHALHVVVLHEAASGELGEPELLVALVEDFACGLRREELLDAEGGLQLQVGPVVEGVAEGVGHGLGPLLELLPVGGVLAGAVALVDAVGAHGAPLVVVAAEP